MKTIRWGIIGCGDVTERKSGPGFYKAAGSELVAVMRRDGAKAEDYARRHGVRKWTTDAAAVIEDPEVDAVYVATMPDTHEHYAMRVAGSGKPCYVEKPLTRNASEARRMVAKFQEKGLPLYAAYYRRALPRFVEAKRLLGSGAIGELREVTYVHRQGGMLRTEFPPESKPWRLEAEVAGGGLFLDLGSHALDLLDHLVGPLGEVTGRARGGKTAWGVEEQVEMTFRTHAGVPGRASWNFADASARGSVVPGASPWNAIDPAAADHYFFLGSEGSLMFSCFGNEPLVLSRKDGSREEISRPNPEHVHQPLIQLMVDELRGVGNERMPSTGETALRTQVVMDAVLEEFYGGREDGFWRRRGRNRGNTA